MGATDLCGGPRDPQLAIVLARTFSPGPDDHAKVLYPRNPPSHQEPQEWHPSLSSATFCSADNTRPPTPGWLAPGEAASASCDAYLAARPIAEPRSFFRQARDCQNGGRHPHETTFRQEPREWSRNPFSATGFVARNSRLPT